MEIENQKGVEAEGAEASAGENNPAPEENENSQGTAEEQAGSQNQDQQDPKDKTAFIKMRQENKNLRDRLSQYETQDQAVDEDNRILDDLRGGYQGVPESGFTPDMDAEAALSRMSAAERTAYEAKQETTRLRTELENQRLYGEFPELNPQGADYKKPETRVFEELLAGQYLVKRMNGERVDLNSLARKVKQSLGGATEAQANQAADKAVEKVRSKEQATLEARGSNINIPRSDDREALRDRTRRGDLNALSQTLLEDELADLEIT